jgi:hypothetical protein
MVVGSPGLGTAYVFRRNSNRASTSMSLANQRLVLGKPCDSALDGGYLAAAEWSCTTSTYLSSRPPGHVLDCKLRGRPTSHSFTKSRTIDRAISERWKRDLCDVL